MIWHFKFGNEHVDDRFAELLLQKRTKGEKIAEALRGRRRNYTPEHLAHLGESVRGD